MTLRDLMWQFAAIVLGLGIATAVNSAFASTQGGGPSVPKCKEDIQRYPIGDKVPEEDGLIHIRYKHADGNSDGIERAFSLAVTQWNEHSEATGVVFEEASSLDTVDLQIEFKDTDKTREECGHYSPENMAIRFGTAIRDFADDESDKATTVLAHELGHVLGLADAGPGAMSIMGNPQGPEDNCTSFTVAESAVLMSDAQAAGGENGCVARARAARRRGPNTEDRPVGAGCYARYEVTHYFICGARGCEYWYSDYQYVTTICYI